MSHYFKNDPNLLDKPKLLDYLYEGINLTFKTNSGVFSRDHIDFGSKLLVETFLENNTTGKALDLGCGYGFIGLTVAKCSNMDMTLIDINEQAVTLAKENMQKNNLKVNIKVSDGFNEISDKYNYIITNPPIRIGKKEMYKLLFAAKAHLLENGELWLVIRKEKGAKSLIKDLEINYNIDIVDKKKGFDIHKALIHFN